MSALTTAIEKGTDCGDRLALPLGCALIRMLTRSGPMETELGHSLERDRGREAFAYPNEKSMPKALNAKHTQMKSVYQ